MILSNMGKDADASIAFSKVLEIDPEHSGAMAQKGLNLGMQRQYAQSFALLDKALEKDPSNWFSLYAKGLVWKLKGNDLKSLDRRYEAIKSLDNALQAFEKATSLNQNNANCGLEKGLIFKDLERGNEAIRALNKSIDLDPMNSKACMKGSNAKKSRK